jgi:transposase
VELRDRFNNENADEDRRGHAYEDYVQRLRDLTERQRLNEENERFAKHLYNHAASWFLFLVDPTLPATNHRAEQALRTPIVNRKVSGGNRTDDGGTAQEVTSSVLQTCKNRAIDVFQFIGNAFRGVLGSLFA